MSEGTRRISRPAAVVTSVVAAVLVFPLLAGLSGCGGGDSAVIAQAVGSYGDVAVLVSNPVFTGSFSPILDAIVPRERFVIQEEPLYRFKFYAPSEWQKGRNYRNLLLLVRWGDGGAVQDLAKRLVSAKTRDRILAGGGGVVVRHDPLFKRQLGVVVMAPNPRRLREILQEKGPALMDTLTQDIRRRIVADHRQSGLLAAAVDHVARACGFSLEIPATWRENQFRPGGFPGVEWLRTDGMTRGITVAWREVPDPDAALADTATLLDLRRDLGHALHHEELVPGSLRWGRDRVAGLPAVMLAGDWRSKRVSVGGPFRCYFVADPGHHRLFCLDLLVYAPNREKMDAFRRLRAVLETLRTDVSHRH